MKKVTLKDIAKKLGISVGAVSHALNGKADISEETKNKIFACAREMGYITNGAAVSLRSGKTHTVAVIVPDISNPHIAYQVKLVEDELRQNGYSTIILNTDEDEAAEKNAITLACSRQVDGILLCPCQRSTASIEYLRQLGIPFVLIGRYFQNEATDYVVSDDVKGGYLAGKYLIQKGCRNPLYVGAFRYIEGSTQRYEGLKRAYEEIGVSLPESGMIEISPKTAPTDDFVKLLDGKSYDSVVVFSDLLAYGILAALKNQSVPVVGFDGINTRLPMPFSYCSVGMVSGGWARDAALAILGKIFGKNESVCLAVDVKLYEYDA